MNRMNTMHSADLVILAVLALSLIFGFIRGFVREIFALAGWILAIIIARWFNEPLAAWLAPMVGTPSVRLVLAYGSLFFGTLVACSLFAYALSLAVRAGGLSLLDRVFGGVFGVLRGALLVLVALMLSAPFVKQDAWFKESQLPKAFLKYELLARDLQTKALHLVNSAKPESITPGKSH